MAASYPKVDGQKVTRHAPRFDWVALPAEGRPGAPPKLPPWRKWTPGTRKWWRELWSKPQAVAWEPSGSSVWALACLYDDLIAGRADAAKVSSEIRAHEDRHGLNPKAMLQLRWRIAEPVPLTRARRSRYAHLEVAADALAGA